jgi:hypothetical protein
MSSALARRARIAAGEVEERVTAPIVFGGLVSRLVSPQLGAAVLGGVLPDLPWRTCGDCRLTASRSR